MAKPNSIPVSVPSINNDRINELRTIFPEAFSEDKVDFDKLRSALGDIIEDSPERYSFSWAGKRDAIRLLQTPTRATLIPSREESVNFDTTQNIFIEGENLEVLKLLYKSYFGRVKMIYIDPPYNTGNDFIYPDDYTDPLGKYLELTGQQDASGNLLTSNPETSGRYHSAWLSMMYPRLFLARQLLREDGVIFVSIDDHEVHNLRMLMNEIFGEENFLATIVWEKVYAPKPAVKTFSNSHDFILVYSKNSEKWERILLTRTSNQDARYSNLDNDPRGPWASDNLLRNEHRDNSVYTIVSPTGKEWTPKKGTSWRHPEDEMLRMIENNEIWFGSDGNGMPRRKKFLFMVQQGLVPETLWKHTSVGHTQDAKREIISLFGYDAFETPKPSSLIKFASRITTSGNDIILDFFSGSASTAHACLELNREDNGNRQFILVQLPEPTGNPEFHSIADIGKERIRRVIKRMNKEREGQLLLESRTTLEDLGFRVYKLAPSHFKTWVGVAEQDPAVYAQQLDLFRDPLVEGWTVEGVFAELAVKHGYSLGYSVETLPSEPCGGGTFYKVTDPERGQFFYACLDKWVSLGDVRKLNLGKEDLFICRDAALDDDAVANLALQCRLETI